MPPRPRSLPHINRLRNLQTPTLRLIAPRSRISQRSFATHVETPGFIGRPPPGTTTPAAKPSEPKGVAEIGPLPEYRRRIALGLLKPDQEQLRAVVRLQKLCEDLLDYSPPEIKPFSGKPLWQRGFKVFGRDGGMQKLTENAFAGKSIIPVLIDGEEPDYIGPRGLWIHGEVGTGKTLLLDLFHASMPTALKHRLHFHHLVSSIHAKLRDWSNLPMDSAARQSDAHVTMAIAREMVAEGWLLCFDEFQVTDVATAVIVRQVLAGMFRLGAVMVVTSNRAPDELYQGGFQRSVYAPFIDLIKERCDVVHVRSETDYRAVMAEERPPPQKEQVYLYLMTRKGNKSILSASWVFLEMTMSRKRRSQCMAVPSLFPKPRRWKSHFCIRRSLRLQRNPMGPVDYLELCSRYHTLVVQNVPIMGLAQKNEARRFIRFWMLRMKTRSK
ncbi:AFG1-like ATPase-domain-containing protein [Chytridium lagenaria]|nr:AFG1-like ATPase-domain-containing protein [Chytridium lagenaria]